MFASWSIQESSNLWSRRPCRIQPWKGTHCCWFSFPKCTLHNNHGSIQDVSALNEGSLDFPDHRSYNPLNFGSEGLCNDLIYAFDATNRPKINETKGIFQFEQQCNKWWVNSSRKNPNSSKCLTKCIMSSYIRNWKCLMNLKVKPSRSGALSLPQLRITSLISLSSNSASRYLLSQSDIFYKLWLMKDGRTLHRSQNFSPKNFDVSFLMAVMLVTHKPSIISLCTLHLLFLIFR